ncbi:hypothetical protein cyc_05908 [Cyclospora cayetanensis]|uniref:Uncharacterized protein n=1 Tax=Cyclospora cayetanensis TaxID=88456 RepID=A0A1D3D787_9EIME|nr:hypothetical protein cyc_05908 [Cyclospora cayetanensis]
MAAQPRRISHLPSGAVPSSASPLANSAPLPGLLEDSDAADAESEICTQHLRDAVNAAISHVIGSRELTDYLLPLWELDNFYVPVLVCGPTVPPPAPSVWGMPAPVGGHSSLPWPKRNSLLPDDLLQQILLTGTVRVAGIGRTDEEGFLKSNKGAAGNFTENPATGFFPDYLRSIWKVISRRYGVNVTVTYLFYNSVEEAQAAVAVGDADMTDIYFLLAHKNSQTVTKDSVAFNTANPLSFLYMTCPVVGAVLFTYTRDGETDTFGGLIDALTSAYNEVQLPEECLLPPFLALVRTESGKNIAVVVSTEELRSAVEPILPDWTLIHVVDSMASALNAVAKGEAFAAFALGPSGIVPPPPGVSLREGIDVILAKGSWIRRSRGVKCLTREHFNDLRE